MPKRAKIRFWAPLPACWPEGPAPEAPRLPAEGRQASVPILVFCFDFIWKLMAYSGPFPYNFSLHTYYSSLLTYLLALHEYWLAAFSLQFCVNTDFLAFLSIYLLHCAWLGIKRRICQLSGVRAQKDV